MAEAIRLDIVVDDGGRAQEALNKLYQGFRAAGDSAEVAADKVNKFERAYANTTAKRDAAKALDNLRKGHDDAGEAARQHASQMQALSGKILQFVGPSVVIAATRKTLEWADSISDLAERTKFSTTAVQQMGKIAEQNNSSFTALAGAVQVAEQRLVEGNKKALEAVAAMGLSVDQLLAAKPEDRLRLLAVGLSEIEDPARRSAAEMAVFGRTGDALAPTLNDIAKGLDKTKSALGEDFIRAGDNANRMLETMEQKANNSAKPMMILPAVIGEKVGEWSRDSTLGTAFEMLGLHHLGLPGQAPKGTGPYGTTLPETGRPGWRPPIPTPAGPLDLGNSQGFIERSLRLIRGGGGAGTSAPWSYPGSSLTWMPGSQWWAPGNRGVGTFPGWAPPPVLPSGGSPLSLENGMQLPGGVRMNAPGGGGGNWFSNLFKGRGGQIAGMGLGLLGNLIPGQSRAGASWGGLAGSFFGPLGSGIGSLLGGTVGRLFGTDPKKLARNAEIGEVFKQFSSKEFISLQKEADRLGVSLQKALNAKTMKDFAAATEEAAAEVAKLVAMEDEIKALTEATTVNFDKMQGVVEEFGLDIAKLGKGFQQAALNADAQRIIDAVAIMERGGADLDGVLDGMADEISALVQQSIKFGTTIPDNMKPWIQRLIEAGKLTDENGQAITDISKIQFGPTLVSEIDKLVKKLGELIDALNGVRDRSREATDSIEDLSRVRPPDWHYNPGGPGDSPVNVSTGGLIQGPGRVLRFNRGGFVPSGTDTVPAMLTPGELVLPRHIVRQLGQGQASAGEVGIFIVQTTDTEGALKEFQKRFPRMAASGKVRTAIQRAAS